MPQYAQYLKAPMGFPGQTVLNLNDQWIDELTEFVFDGGRLKSWPSQSAPQNGAIIKNLVNNKPDMIVRAPSAGTVISFREGGFDMLERSSVNFIEAINPSDFLLNGMGNPDFAIIVWLKLETGFSTGDYQNYIGRGSNTTGANYEIRITSHTGGVGLTWAISGTESVSGSIATSAADYNELWGSKINKTNQLAMSFVGNSLIFYINGVPVRSVTRPTSTKPYNNMAAQPTQTLKLGAGIGGNPFRGIFKRWCLTRIGNQKTAAERILDDYNQNHVRLNAV